MRRRTVALALALPLWQPGRSLADAAAGYDERPEGRLFATDVASRQGWPLDWVLDQLREARLRTTSQRLMMPGPGGRRPDWSAYHDRFVEPRRIAAGVAFWRANEAALTRAETDFGVPREIVVGIIGVETFYGRVMGDFRVLDALATLSFDFPEGRSDRSGYFLGELEAFLVLTRRDGVDPSSVRGSFAGAMGLPQFMPSSINRYALDFDGNGHIDLHRSPTDAIGSVARFLAEHGWKRGMPTHYTVVAPSDGAARARLLAPDIVPTFTADEMSAAGAVLSDAGRAHGGPLALVMVENGDRPPSHYAGTSNFFSLTRYNRSSYYALGVIHLGQAVRASM